MPHADGAMTSLFLAAFRASIAPKVRVGLVTPIVETFGGTAAVRRPPIRTTASAASLHRADRRSREPPLSRRRFDPNLPTCPKGFEPVSIARVLRTVLASLYLLVGIGFAVPSARPVAHAASAATVAVIGCSDHAADTSASHHPAKPPCAPTGKIADHRHCPNCPAGGSCSDAPPAATVATSVLVTLRSANRPAWRTTTDPTGRNPPPDPRPPRDVA